MQKFKAATETVKCFVCGKEFKQITHKHLKRHNLTLSGYMDKYDLVKIDIFSLGTLKKHQLDGINKYKESEIMQRKSLEIVGWGKRKRPLGLTPRQKATYAKKIYAALSQSEKENKLRGLKAHSKIVTIGQRMEQIKHMNFVTKDRRSEITKKGWKTRRAFVSNGGDI